MSNHPCHQPKTWELFRDESEEVKNRRAKHKEVNARIDKDRRQDEGLWWDAQRYVDQVVPAEYVDPKEIDTYRYRYQVFARPPPIQCPPTSLNDVSDEPPPIRYNIKRVAIEKPFPPAASYECAAHNSQKPFALRRNPPGECSYNNQSRNNNTQSCSHQMAASLTMPQNEDKLTQFDHGINSVQGLSGPTMSKTIISPASKCHVTNNPFVLSKPGYTNANNSRVFDSKSTENNQVNFRSVFSAQSGENIAASDSGTYTRAKSVGRLPTGLQSQTRLVWPDSRLPIQASSQGNSATMPDQCTSSRRLPSGQRDDKLATSSASTTSNCSAVSSRPPSSICGETQSAVKSNQVCDMQNANANYAPRRDYNTALNKPIPSFTNLERPLPAQSRTSLHSRKSSACSSASSHRTSKYLSNYLHASSDRLHALNPSRGGEVEPKEEKSTISLVSNSNQSNTYDVETTGFRLDVFADIIIPSSDGGCVLSSDTAFLERVWDMAGPVKERCYSLKMPVHPLNADCTNNNALSGLDSQPGRYVLQCRDVPTCGEFEAGTCHAGPQKRICRVRGKQLPPNQAVRLDQVKPIDPATGKVSRVAEDYDLKCTPLTHVATGEPVMGGPDRRDQIVVCEPIRPSTPEIGYGTYKIVGSKQYRQRPEPNTVENIRLPPDLEEYREFTRRCPNYRKLRYDRTDPLNEMLIPSNKSTQLLSGSLGPFTFCNIPKRKLAPLFEPIKTNSDLSWSLPGFARGI